MLKNVQHVVTPTLLRAAIAFDQAAAARHLHDLNPDTRVESVIGRLERFPTIEAGACSVTVPCNAPWFVELGFITLAFMCLSGMALIATLLIVDRAHERATQEVTP